VEERDVLEASARRPREGAPLYGLLAHLEDDPHGPELDESTRGRFLLGRGRSGRKLAVLLTEAPATIQLPPTTEVRRFDVEYLFLDDRLGS
jgi:hypothetical protein